MVRITWKKNPYTGDWESSDKRWEISPAYEPSLRGGSVTRPSHWIAKDRTGRRESYSAHLLADAKAYCYPTS